MQFRYGLVVAWIVATMASILVAFAAVGSVRTAITDPPSALLLPESDSPDRTLPSLPDSQQSTVPDPDVADGAPAASTEIEGVNESDPSEPSTPESEQPQPPGTTVEQPATTAPPQASEPPSTTDTTVVVATSSTTISSTTTTTVAPSDALETYETEGGWVTVRSNSSGAFLESASPKAGWTVETEGRGPEHFTVVFEREDEEIHFKVEFEDGQVEIDIES